MGSVAPVSRHQHHATTRARWGRSSRFAKCGDCRCSILRKHACKCMLRGMYAAERPRREGGSCSWCCEAQRCLIDQQQRMVDRRSSSERVMVMSGCEHCLLWYDVSTWPSGDMRIKLSDQALRSALLSQASSCSLFRALTPFTFPLPAEARRNQPWLSLRGCDSATCIFPPPPPCNDGILGALTTL